MGTQVTGRLTPLEAKNAMKPGLYNDGKGLYLQVTGSGTKSWLYRYTFKGKTRDMGLGAYPGVSLALARKLHNEHKTILKDQKRDPIEVRDAALVEQARKDTEQKLAADRRMTFADAVGKYKARPNYGKRVIKGRIVGPFNPKYLYQIERAMDVASEGFGDMDVAEITDDDVERIIDPIWLRTPETAHRTLLVIRGVLGIKEVRRHTKKENPASVALMEDWVETHPKNAETSHPALPWKDVPAFMVSLRNCGGMGAACLRLVILCGSRQGEARGARWSEIDLEGRKWRIPAGRMKARVAHTVPLSDAAVSLLETLPRLPGTDLVFPSQSGKEMSDMTLGKVVKDMHARELKAGRKGWVDPEQENRAVVVHGFRSTLADWAADYLHIDDEIAERSLAHTVGTDISRRYKRTQMLERRGEFLGQWAAYCNGEDPANNVVQLRGGIA